MNGRRPLSLARTLPLLTTVVVVVVLATALLVTGLTLTGDAYRRAQERVERSARQMAALAAGSVQQTLRPLHRIASRDSAVRALLQARGAPRAETAARARAALADLTAPNDSALPVELWSADGRLLLSVDDDAPAIWRQPAPEIADASPRAMAGVVLPPREGLDSLLLTDSLQLGALHGDGGRAHYWLAMPILEAGRPLGFITQRRRLALNPRAAEALRELGGTDMAAYYRNADGRFWTTSGGEIVEPPETARVEEGVVHRRPAEGELLFGESPIAGTPFFVIMEVPVRTVLAPVHALVRRLSVLSVFLTLMGALVAWVIGRRLTRPLVELTRAAESIAGGDYKARVTAGGADEVSRLAASFNHMAEQVGTSLAALELASRAKSDFLAIMSHELRTPLNAIGGYTELLEMELRGPITEAQRRDLSRIRNSQQHLLSLISGVLDLTRFETGQVSYDMADVALDPLLLGLDALVEPQAAAKQLTLHYTPCGPGLSAIADREKLRQVLLNLLSNAIRYTPAGGTVTLAASASDAATVRITVSDTGPGIPIERQEEIFEPFVQLDRSLTQSREGVGLGLSISRDLARGMGGDLHVESTPGDGARFVITLAAGAGGDPDSLRMTGEIAAVTANRTRPDTPASGSDGVRQHRPAQS